MLEFQSSNKIRISIQTQLNTNKKYAIKNKSKINFANNLKHEKKKINTTSVKKRENRKYFSKA